MEPLEARWPGSTRRMLLVSGGGAAIAGLLGPGAAQAASASELDRSGRVALARLYRESTKAKTFGEKSVAVLVFPKITKAGFLVGAMSGPWVLFEHGRPNTYYNISAGSYGLQAGVQTYSYALFFVRKKALAYLDSSKGWAVGSSPSVVVADKGFAKNTDTTTLTQDVYAVPFWQSGLMAGMGLQGSKITRIHPKD
jgi:lipid-binding SYLF domain-containing protein